MSSAVLPKHVATVIRYQKDPLRALEMFNSVKKEDGFKHTLLTYRCMVEKLGHHEEFDAMENIVSEMRENLDNSLLEGVYVSVMRSYGKRRKIQEAANVFERMDFYNCEPTVYSYNAIMNILVENGYFDQAHKLYMRLKEKGIAPDVYTYTIRIKSFCRTSRPHAALRLLNNMPAQRCEVNSVAYCTVVSGFYEGDYSAEAHGLFDEMLRLGLVPNVTTFNKLMHTLCKKGDIRESEMLLDKVLKRGVLPNLFTFNIFIQGLCKKGLPDGAARMLENVTAEGLSPDVVTYNTLICGLCKSSKVVEAENYMNKMVNSGLKPDAFTYNTLIEGYCRINLVQKADKILQDAVFRGFVPDEFTYCSLLYGLCENGDIERATSMFNEAPGKGIKPSVILYNTLIKGFCRQGLILEALQLMNEMQQKGCNPDIWTYNLIINGLCKMCCLTDASILINDATTKGLLPDIFTFNTLIDGYCKQLKMGEALGVVNTMWEHGITPDIITYNSILDGLCKTSNSDNVMETFNLMEEKGCRPNIITYNILVESFCKARKLERALELLDEIQKNGMHPDNVILGTLISGFCENSDLDEAFLLFRRMEKDYRLSPTLALYNILINAFSERLNMDMALKLFQEMGIRGCPADKYTFRCMVDGFCKTGNVDSGYCYLLDGITKGFIPSLTTFGRVLNCLCVKHRLHEAAEVIYLMVQRGVVPEEVSTIFEADKKEVAAPKLVVENLLKKSHITYYTYEVLYEAVRQASDIVDMSACCMVTADKWLFQITGGLLYVLLDYLALLYAAKAWKKSKKITGGLCIRVEQSTGGKLFAFQAVDLRIEAVTNGIKKVMARNRKR
ncbi:Pentatricopeptide repeat superfamily protein [Perilla frutescens var. frutescens]|nr:Pentatricopeptide repeat superfamily protein [Perilla frutescens var. frutescens]